MRSFIKTLSAAASLAFLLGLGACQSSEGGAGPSAPAAHMEQDVYASAIADPARPAADVARDGARKPADMLAFAEVRKGEKIGELISGGGYFTRIFAKATGPSGHVYSFAPPRGGGDGPPPDPTKIPPIQVIASDPAYGNITVLHQNFAALAPGEPLDLVWTSQNYHDLHLARFHLDVVAVNKSIFNALRPGGLYIVLDHAAAAGTGLDVPDKLHRINPDIVKAEVTAAGFQFVGESTVLRNPADDHTKAVFDPAVRGHTDQFIYKFRKPS